MAGGLRNEATAVGQSLGLESFLLHPLDARGKLCKVTELGCFPHFCSVPEECESLFHRAGGLSPLTWIPRMALEITVSSVV